MMRREVSWILGWQDGAEVRDAKSFSQSYDREGLTYGGFLWADLDLSSLLPRFHPSSLLGFQAGWSAVGFSCRTQESLGPWLAPTSARPHAHAPFGIYLLSQERLKRSLPDHVVDSRELAEAVHFRQPRMGPVFCDPKLEVRLSGPRDFLFRPPSKRTVLLSALNYLISGQR